MAIAKKVAVICTVLLIVAGCVLYGLWDNNALSFPVSKYLTLDTPYQIRDTAYERYILDKQRMRIVVVDKKTNVVKTVLPKKQKNADVFYYADEFQFDENGFVYVKEGSWNGNVISREAVLIYDNNGHYVSTVLDTQYGELVNKHKMHLLSVRNGKLHYAVREAQYVIVASFDIARNTEIKKIIPFDNAFDFVSDITEDAAGTVYVLDKTGCLYMLNDEKTNFERAYRFPADEFPNWIEFSAPHCLLYTDLYTDSVKSVNLKSGEKALVLSQAGSVTVTPVSFSLLQNPLKNTAMLQKEILLLVSLLAAVLCAIFLFVFAVIAFFKRKMHIIRRITFYIVMIVIAVAGTITYKLTNEFSRVMREQLLAQMENMAHSVANSIQPETVDSIQSAADFASPAYRKMISDMKSVVDTRLEVNRSIYCDILKYDEKHGAYACAYLDQAIGTFFPLPESSAQEVLQVYETRETIRSGMDEYSGSYTYVYVPILSETGSVSGVVAVLTENFMLDNQINSMKKSVLLGIVITLIFVWLLMGELLSYILSKSQAEMEMQEKRVRGDTMQKSFPHYYIRLMVFSLFAAYNLTTTFLPMVIVRGAVETLGKDCPSFIMALPISVNLFIIGLMALFCESIIKKMGVKKIILLGTSLSVISNILIFACMTNYPALMLALVIDGIGVGLSTNAMYLMVSRIREAKNRSLGYASYNAAQISGINFGMLFGAALALNIGRNLVFPLVSLMWIFSALLFVLLWRAISSETEPINENPAVEKVRNTPRHVLGFLTRRKVWSFILFVQTPFALMGSFVYYYLPLYSEAVQMSEIVVAILMMLYSLFAIYLGNSLTKWVIEHTGKCGLYISILLSVCAVLVYALTGTFAGLLAAIFMLGLANGFGHSVQQTQFSLLDECDSFGVANAMGIYNFTDFIGQSFGPAVMGLVFFSGNMFAKTCVFAVLLLAVSAAHFIISCLKEDR